jgi:signal transduction histidine kinase
MVVRLSRDIRNNLNAVNCNQLSGELAEEGKSKARFMVARDDHKSEPVWRLTAGLSQVNPNLISYPAADFVGFKRKTTKEFPDNAGKVIWDLQLKDATLQIDPELAQQAFLEIFGNAFQHERNLKAITARAYIANNRFVFELQEPKARFELSTENWGREPLRNVSQGHYGLGLNRVRSVAEAHSGDFQAEYDQKKSTLITTERLPSFAGERS